MNLNSIIIFSQKPKELVEFYKKVLQSETVWEGGDFVTFKVRSGYLTIGPHSKVQGKNSNPERIMINFETSDVNGEFERIKDLGAAVIAKPYNPMEEEKATIATFADLDGNYFQLQTPFEDMM